MMTEQDTGYAPERWQFDGEVTRVFDNMLERSIPQHDSMRELVTSFAGKYAFPGDTLVDLGCSLGNAMEPHVHNGVACIGLDNSPSMVASAQARFQGDQWRVHHHDLKDGLPAFIASRKGITVFQSILTLMFIPLEERHALVRQVYEALQPGGIFIVVEKVHWNDFRMHDMTVDEYHAMKERNGYTKAEIEAKARSLDGVLIPQTPRENEAMLMKAGFDTASFWQWMNFQGWVAFK